MALKMFLGREGLPQSEAEIIVALKSPRVVEVRNFVLGPRKISNIPQACELWLERTGLKDKGTMEIGRIPDEYLVAAQAVNEAGVVPLYWTCAVFGREKDLFFGAGTNTQMFYVQQIMPLDHMQLAARPENLTNREIAELIVNEELLPPFWQKLASHKSPAPLLESLLEKNPHCKWIEADSNGAAAEMCLKGECDACITTETARLDIGLERIHDFGCPDMVFFGGLTQHGAKVLRQAWAEIQENS